MRRKWKWIAIPIVLIGLAAIGEHGLFRYRWLERADAATGVALELGPASQTIKFGETPVIEATVVNRGSREVVLVEPGDGSESSWRTPVIAWSNGHSLMSRCGTMTPLSADEIFTLRPGESRRLNGWVGGPRLRGPSRYWVAVRYTNRPDQPWSGTLFRDSTPVDMVSNTVEIVVER
jgi:hypothetical protein